ncbi:MAG: thioredoxin family protein [Thermodesulfobacteriota bacterium]|nr:thioredoxin family protein [Thermodesulfobacteriota bacterium]
MNTGKLTFIQKFMGCLAGLSMLVLPACTDLPVKPGNRISSGDAVEVHYTCKLDDGQMVATTEQAAGEALSEAELEMLFFRDQKHPYIPVEMVAGEIAERITLQDAAPGTEDIPSLQLKGFHEVMDEQLPLMLVGKPEGRWFKITLTAEAQNEVPQSERTVKLVRAIRAPKTMKVARDQFQQRTGSPAEPVLGGGVGMYRGVAGEIVELTDDTVTIDFFPASEEPVKTMFGTRKVEDKGDHWLVYTDVEEGSLIKTGPHLGQVSDIEGGQFTIDYAHPFGGGDLHCRVMAMSSMPDTGGQMLADEEDNMVAGEDVDLSKTVEEGDLVKVDYTARIADLVLVYTTRENDAKDGNFEKVDWYQEPPGGYVPELITAGADNPPPNIGRVVLGMTEGQKKVAAIPPEEGFGLTNPALVKQFDKIKTRPRTETMDMKKWSQKFDTFPVEGETYDVDLYLNAKVTGITNKEVSVEYMPKAESFDRPLGTVVVKTGEDTIDLVLEPELGATYTLEGEKGPVSGPIVSSDDKTFTVDFNHPLAGKEIRLMVEVVSLTKKEDLENIEMQWVEDHDAGLKQAKEQDKPMVAVLYAAWCGYSKKMLNETLPAPRIKLLKDDFVWVKVDSSKDPYLKELYGQKGFPLTVVVSPEGDVIKKINGYKDAPSFYTELQAAMADMDAEEDKGKMVQKGM